MPRQRDRWDPVCDPPGGLVRPVQIDPLGLTGPTTGQARGPRWRQATRGWYVPVHVDAEMPEQRILEQSVLLPPGGAVTGWAALRLRGARFFDGLCNDGRTPRPVPLNAGVGHPRRPRPGVRWSQDRMTTDEWSPVHGIPAARVERALFDETRRASTLVAAVEGLDNAFAAELTSMSRMQQYVDAHPGWDGVPLSRAALALADENSRSPFESRIRVIWVARAGLPRPLVNKPVFDRRTGRLLGIADLLDEVSGLVGECDGGEHARASRRSRDANRDELFRRHGLETVRITSYDEHRPDTIVDRVLGARSRALWLPEAKRAWTLTPPPWWEQAPSVAEILDERELVRAGQEEWERAGRPGLEQLIGRTGC
jgi:hypothetical protein